MFCATHRLFFALVVPLSARGDTVQIKVTSGGEDLCLALRPDRTDIPGAWHAGGVPAVVRPCGGTAAVSSEYGEDPNRRLAHLWRLDTDGSMVSHISGKCLAVNTSGWQETCKSGAQGWKLRADDGLEFLGKPHHCLSPVKESGRAEWTIELKPCTANPAAWRVETVNLVTYPVIPGWENYASPWYEVTVSLNGKQAAFEHKSFVYFSQPLDGQPLQGYSNSYTTFSFDGEALVTVKRLSGAFGKVVLRPLALNLCVDYVDEQTIRFGVPKPGSKISVEFDDDWTTDPLLIFADPLETDVPSQSDNNVIYYEPGEHYVDNPVILKSHQTVYIAGGAVLFAGNWDQNMFDSGSSSLLTNIQIKGRGIISGKLSGGYPFLITLCGDNHLVEGITMVEAPEQSHLQINAPWYCDGGWSGVAGGGQVHNVKLLSWNFADGIYAGARSLVSDSFTKVNDDGIKPFESDSICERNVHWQQKNGWAIMIAWLTEGHQKNIHVRDSTILHDYHTLDDDFAVAGCEACYPSQASIGAVHGGSGTVSNVVIENIVIEGQVLRPVWVGIDKSVWGTTGAGVIKDFTLKNVRVIGDPLANSQVVSTFDSAQVSGVELHNFEVFSTIASSITEAYLDVIPQKLDVTVASHVPLPPPIPAGSPNFFKFRQDHSKCLDMEGGVPKKGVHVQLWECNGLDSQQWIWDSDAHTIQSATDTSLCLSVHSCVADASIHSCVWLWECDGSRTQVFDWDPQSGGIFHFLTEKLEEAVCLDLPSDHEWMGVQLQLYECKGWVQQSWDRVAVHPTPTTTPPPSGCPGGSLLNCMELCPTTDWSTCVQACIDRCPDAVAFV